MGRFKCGVRHSCVSGLPNKRDTPVKTALSRRYKCRRYLPNKPYEALPEEPEMEDNIVHPVRPTQPILTTIKPAHCNYALRLRSPAFTENPRGNAILSAAPDNKKDGEITLKEEEANLAVTPGSDISSAMESDTTFSSDDDEEDCYSSASTASSSLPSPELFRKEDDVETQAFRFQREELLGLHLNTKNSTLLDASHAHRIDMHHPPNLSTIFDFSVILPENNCEIKQNREPEAETKIQKDSEKVFEWKTPPKLTKRKPILCKKKVWFKSPMTEAKHTPTTNLNGPVGMSSPTEQMRPDADASSAGEINKEDALRLTVRLKRPVNSVLEKARIFDFIDDSERDVFFQRMRERCAKLRSAPPFPLTAVEHT